jgi:ankyrin repeat protein
MDKEIQRILAEVSKSCDFEEVDFSDLNACGVDGDNALHVIVRFGDLAAAKALIEAGIDINKRGDLGYTPLHLACMKGNLEMVKLLVNKGADLFALNEGVPPFTTARLAGEDEICEFLGPLMEQLQSRDPKIRLKSRITQLRREIADLEAKLDYS